LTQTVGMVDDILGVYKTYMVRMNIPG
jgi:hypothetical protein